MKLADVTKADAKGLDGESWSAMVAFEGNS